MTNPFLGQVMSFAGVFTPVNWARCDGQILEISANKTLFSLIGSTYGGNGTSTFALPDLRGRAPMHNGNGPGLTPRLIGSKTGTNTVTLTTDEIPNHTHSVLASSEEATSTSPTNAVTATLSKDLANLFYKRLSSPTRQMAGGAIETAGGSQPHENMMPYQTISFMIAMQGVYPGRS